MTRDEPLQWGEDGLRRLIRRVAQTRRAVEFLDEPAILSIVGRLPEREQQVLFELYQWGLPVEEIGKRHGITRSVVINYITKGVRLLRSRWEANAIRGGAQRFYSLADDVAEELLS